MTINVELCFRIRIVTDPAKRFGVCVFAHVNETGETSLHTRKFRLPARLGEVSYGFLESCESGELENACLGGQAHETGFRHADPFGRRVPIAPDGAVRKQESSGDSPSTNGESRIDRAQRT